MKAYTSENLFVEKKMRHSSYAMPNSHQHKSYELYYLADISGSASITIEGKTFPLKKGCFVIINSFMTHQTNYNQATSVQRILLEINPDFLNNEAGKLVGIPIDFFFQQHTGVHYLDKHVSGQIESVLRMIYDESIFQEKYYERIALLRILEIILLMDRNGERVAFESNLSTSQLKTIRPIVQYIVENIEEPLALEHLAERFHLDKSYLSRTFKQYTGHTVHDFINFKKMEQAQRLLLLYTELSIADIASHLGFNHTAYFTKLFKKYINTTPSQYRKNNSKEIR